MSSMTPSSSRKSKGRQKVEMKKMTNESNLQVTFSKRRSGLFKKASELCTLCGAEVALIVFSPGDKAFSFGHPNVDSVVDRYLTRGTQPSQSSNGAAHLIEAHRNANLRELIAEFTQISAQLDHDKKRGDELNRMRKAIQGQCWWAAPIDEMSRPQLEHFKVALEELKKIVTRHSDRMILIQGASNNSNHFVFGASSSNVAPPLPPPPRAMFQPPSAIQNPGFDGSMMHGFNNNNMRGYGGPGFY